MKKITMIMFVLFATTFSAKAQFGGGWGAPWEPGSPAWCLQQQQQINAMAMQNMIMQQQNLNFYRQQADNVTNWIINNPTTPYPGLVINRDGIIVKYETAAPKRSKTQCDNCNGQGFLYEKYYAGNNKIKTLKRRCGICHGTGKQ